MKRAETVWIVDYDLPANNSRRTFYRRIKRYLKTHDTGETTGWSTQSVVITGDRSFAEFVYEIASHMGHANLYEARQLKSSLPRDLAEKAAGLVTRETKTK